MIREVGIAAAPVNDPPRTQFIGGYDDSDSDSGVLSIEDTILNVNNKDVQQNFKI